MPTLRMQGVAIGMLALAKAMYYVELAAAGEEDVERLEQAAMRVLWRSMRVSQAREVLQAMLVSGQRALPVWCLRYARVTCLAHQAHTLVARYVLVQAVPDELARLPTTGPVGRSMLVVQ